MPSFSLSSVLDPAARAAAALACFVDSDRRPRLSAPKPAAEAAGEDTVAVVVSTADAGGAPPGALAAGVDAGTTAIPAASSFANGLRGFRVDVSASVEGVDSPAAGAFPVDAGGGDASDKVSGGDSANPARAISLRACARRNATASGVSRISAELNISTVVRSDAACASADSASVLALSIRDSSVPAALSRLAAFEPRGRDC